MTTTTKAISDLTQALAENYFGIGSTPQSALAALTEDLLTNRLHADDFGVSHAEMLNAIGNILLEVMERWIS